MQTRKSYKIPLLVFIAAISSAVAWGDILPSPTPSNPVSATSPGAPVQQVIPVATDDVITKTIQQKLSNDTRLTGTNISVVTQNGTVSLSGTTTTAEQIAEAIDTAKSVPGVKEVKSALTMSGAAPPVIATPPAKTATPPAPTAEQY